MSRTSTRASCSARSTPGPSSSGKAQSARVRVERARREPVVRDGAQPGSIPGRRPAARRPATRRRSRQGSSSSASGPTPAARSGCPRPPVARWGSSRSWGLLPLDGVFPLCPSLDTVGPMGRTVEDVALLWSVLSGRPVPEPRLDGLTIGLLRRAPDLGDGRETEQSDAAERWVADLERSRRPCRRGRDPGAQADMWPLFLHEAAQSHRGDLPRPGGRVRQRDADRSSRPRSA